MLLLSSAVNVMKFSLGCRCMGVCVCVCTGTGSGCMRIYDKPNNKAACVLGPMENGMATGAMQTMTMTRDAN